MPRIDCIHCGNMIRQHGSQESHGRAGTWYHIKSINTRCSPTESATPPAPSKAVTLTRRLEK